MPRFPAILTQSLKQALAPNAWGNFFKFNRFTNTCSTKHLKETSSTATNLGSKNNYESNSTICMVWQTLDPLNIQSCRASSSRSYLTLLGWPCLESISQLCLDCLIWGFIWGIPNYLRSHLSTWPSTINLEQPRRTHSKTLFAPRQRKESRNHKVQRLIYSWSPNHPDVSPRRGRIFCQRDVCGQKCGCLEGSC